MADDSVKLLHSFMRQQGMQSDEDDGPDGDEAGKDDAEDGGEDGEGGEGEAGGEDNEKGDEDGEGGENEEAEGEGDDAKPKKDKKNKEEDKEDSKDKLRHSIGNEEDDEDDDPVTGEMRKYLLRVTKFGTSASKVLRTVGRLIPDNPVGERILVNLFNKFLAPSIRKFKQMEADSKGKIRDPRLRAGIITVRMLLEYAIVGLQKGLKINVKTAEAGGVARSKQYVKRRKQLETLLAPLEAGFGKLMRNSLRLIPRGSSVRKDVPGWDPRHILKREPGKPWKRLKEEVRDCEKYLRMIRDALLNTIKTMLHYAQDENVLKKIDNPFVIQCYVDVFNIFGAMHLELRKAVR